MLSERLWRPNSGCEHSQWVISFSSGNTDVYVASACADLFFTRAPLFLHQETAQPVVVMIWNVSVFGGENLLYPTLLILFSPNICRSFHRNKNALYMLIGFPVCE